MEEEFKKTGKPYLFRYRADNDYTLDEIENSYIYFSERESLNDPFDSSPDLINFTSDKIDPDAYLQLFRKYFTSEKDKMYFDKNYSIEELIKLTKEYIPKYLNEFGISCFSMFPYINMTLWANYANNHKGICLQFNYENDIEFFQGWRVVKYFEELKQIEYNPTENESQLMDVFYIKDKNWSYEKEVRLVKMKKGKVNFKKKSLRNIICGYKTDIEYIDKIINICKKEHPSIGVYQMDKPTKQNNVSLSKMY